jgi:hypothetical protein
VVIRVTNVDDDLDGVETYDVSLGGSSLSTGGIADGSSGTVTFNNLSANSYPVTVTRGGVEVASTTVNIATCGSSALPPRASAVSQGCVAPGKSTGSVVVGVTNADDGTNDDVVYTITLTGVAGSQSLTVADGASGSVTFTGLAAGTYSASVSGDDGTSASASATVAQCNEQPTPPKDRCPNIAGIQQSVPKGMVITGTGDCMAPSVEGTETAKPGPKGPKPGVNKPGTTERPAEVAGTQAAIPTGADAGLATMATASSGSVTTMMAQLLVAGGLLLLLTGGCIGLGRRTRGVHEA